VLSYAEVVKAPAQKLINTAQVTINAHEFFLATLLAERTTTKLTRAN
jgi:hypothetical protein